MTPNKTIQERLVRMRDLIGQDPKLAEELNDKRSSAAITEEAKKINETINANNFLESANEELGLEAVILRVGRPVLTILNSEAKLEFVDAESEVWRDRLIKAKEKLAISIPAVGRIELQNHFSLDWCGTGWFIDEDTVVTNRHVAEIFGRNKGAEFIFRQGVDGDNMTSDIDLLEEFGRPDKMLFSLEKILHIEPEPGPDFAFIRAKPINNSMPSPVKIDTTIITGQPEVAVIGYPAKDSRMPDAELMERLFGNAYDKKRLAPGNIRKSTEARLFHDCSTLGGCSGAAVLSLETGKAIGLHFAGRFLESNYAVPISLIWEKLKKIKNGKTSIPVTGIENKSIDMQGDNLSLSSGKENTATLTIPLEVSISFGIGEG